MNFYATVAVRTCIGFIQHVHGHLLLFCDSMINNVMANVQ